jgi:hypothetical protein
MALGSFAVSPHEAIGEAYWLGTIPKAQCLDRHAKAFEVLPYKKNLVFAGLLLRVLCLNKIRKIDYGKFHRKPSLFINAMALFCRRDLERNSHRVSILIVIYYFFS